MRVQAALLVKCIIVALLGSDKVLPDTGGQGGRHGVGLLFMFASICISSSGLCVQLLTAQRLVSGTHSGCSRTLVAR